MYERKGGEADEKYIADSGEKIHSITAFELHRLINQRYGLLLLDNKSPLPQFVCETRHISGFQQTWTQDAVNLDGCADDGLRDLVQPLSLVHMGKGEFKTPGTKEESNTETTKKE